MATWEWKAGDAWVPYDEKSNQKIVKAARKNKTIVEISAPSGTIYIIDLIGGRQVQKNAPSKSRRVRWNDGSLPRTLPKVVHTTVTTTVVPHNVAAPSPPGILMSAGPSQPVATVVASQPQFMPQMTMQTASPMGMVQTQQVPGTFPVQTSIPPTGYPPGSPGFSAVPTYTQAPLPAYGTMAPQVGQYQQQQPQYVTQTPQYQPQQVQVQSPPSYHQPQQQQQQPQYVQANPGYGGFHGHF